MNRFSKRFDLPPAIGQVVVMAFKEERKSVTSLTSLKTVLIAKPNAKFPRTFYKFPGGMQLQGETLGQTVVRELEEETGVTMSSDQQNLFELCRVKKARHYPHSGEFDIVFFAAFGCNFSKLNDPLHGDVGDEGEESMLATFADIVAPGHSWPIATRPNERADMFPFHLALLETASQNVMS